MQKTYLKLDVLMEKYKHLPEHRCWAAEDILAWYEAFRINGMVVNGEILIEEGSYNRLIEKSLEGC